MVRTGATFQDAAAEYMRWLTNDRQRKPSTLRDYNSILHAHLLPEFGDCRLEDITTDQVETWSARLASSGRVNNRTRLKILTVLHGVMGRGKRVWKLPRNPVSDVEKPVQGRSTTIEVFSTEEIHALVRAAHSEQDAAIYPPRSPACAAASSSRSAGGTSTSRAGTSGSPPPTQSGPSQHPSPGRPGRCR